MREPDTTRRGFLALAAAAGSALLVTGTARPPRPTLDRSADSSAAKNGDGNRDIGPPVTASEDLMREHGVLRRALLVYAEAAMRLRRAPETIPPAALQNTAQLFRAFGENYHEKMLEEAYIFPAVRKAGGAAAAYPDLLATQHERGREITTHVLIVTRGPKLGAQAAQLADVLDGFVRMYQHHAAREDTIVFPAWKSTLSDEQYAEMGERFESIEREQFGANGFEAAVQRISAIESSLGLADIALFTAPPPPAR